MVYQEVRKYRALFVNMQLLVLFVQYSKKYL